MYLPNSLESTVSFIEKKQILTAILIGIRAFKSTNLKENSDIYLIIRSTHQLLNLKKKRTNTRIRGFIYYTM